MLTFLRKIRRSFIESGSARKYLLYAIGEVALVVIGILIALQINNWNEWRKNHNTLQGYLIFMLEDIESDRIQLINLIQDRETSIMSSTEIIDSYKKLEPISTLDFLNSFHQIVVEQRFENNTNGFDKAQTSKLFDSQKFLKIRNLVRDYKKAIDEIKFKEFKQNSSSEAMEAELLRNGFYDNSWPQFRSYYRPEKFQSPKETIDFLEELRKYGEVKAIFLRNEWAMPGIIKGYKKVIDIGEKLKKEIADAGQSMAIYNLLFTDFELLQAIESSSLKKYVNQLSEFEKEFRSKEMPDIEFYLFGMGNRTKLLYKDGVLKTAISGEIIKQWPVKRDLIIPNEYKVEIETLTDVFITIYEDENGVYIKEGRKNERVEDTKATVKLPTFEGHKYSEILKVLNHEILINIVESKPVPNFIVYNKPWRRDAAMMAMCLEETGNLNLIKDWVLNLNEAYDRNNEGNTEPDNLGQTLYLLSLFSDKNHPLVSKILEDAKEFEVEDENGLYIKGLSDFHETPVYQTKWMKFGLNALGMEDLYSIPKIHDNYSSLFWWDYKDSYLEGTTDAYDQWENDKYPYIGWAADNFHGKKRNPISNRLYPLTWEQEASQAKYENLGIIDEVYVTEKISAPHTWHAAEVFLYLVRQNNYNNKF